MQLIISILVIGLLWMIYDIINAPAVDENENEIIEAQNEEPPKEKQAPRTKRSDKILEDSEVDDPA